MIPQTIGREYDVGKVASVQCVKNDTLKDLEIKTHCFLMLIIREGTAYFQVGDMAFEAVGPCFVCFDEREQPKLIRKRGLKCDTIYFHPKFLNVNMTFQLVHSGSYDQVATSHDLFLLKPFTDDKRYVFPLFEEYIDNLNRLFSNLEAVRGNRKELFFIIVPRNLVVLIVEMQLKKFREYKTFIWMMKGNVI